MHCVLCSSIFIRLKANKGSRYSLSLSLASCRFLDSFVVLFALLYPTFIGEWSFNGRAMFCCCIDVAKPIIQSVDQFINQSIKK